jgi:predicted nucleotidyltransferase
VNKQEIINTITPILNQYPVRRASFFGSYARGDFTEKSDLDMLVDFDIENVGLMFFSLREDLADALPMNLDLIYKPGLARMEAGFIKNIEKEESIFYEKNT